MNLHTWLIFAGSVILLTASPGPNALLALSHGVKHGLKNTFATICGSLLAFIILMVASLAGIGAIMASSVWMFETIRWLGAAYLIYLGVKMWRSTPKEIVADEIEPSDKSKIALFRKGFLVAISNPKIIIFFASFFPQFINPAYPQLQQMVILGVTFVSLELSWQLLYAGGGNKISAWINTPKRQQIIDRVSGSLFIAAGTLLLFSKK
jgi:RhtB (resistance to homoserine/threonine) family protein